MTQIALVPTLWAAGI